jgi:hypothetical protein
MCTYKMKTQALLTYAVGTAVTNLNIPLRYFEKRPRFDFLLASYLCHHILTYSGAHLVFYPVSTS